MKRESMKLYPVILLRDFDKNRSGDHFYKEGEVFYAQMFPSGHWALMENQFLLFRSSATEGIDFVFRDYDVLH